MSNFRIQLFNIFFFFFETGLSSIRAASTPNRSQEFQVGYLKCRSDFLQALSQLVYTCHSLRTSPPPAIASSQAKVLQEISRQITMYTLINSVI